MKLKPSSKNYMIESFQSIVFLIFFRMFLLNMKLFHNQFRDLLLLILILLQLFQNKNTRYILIHFLQDCMYIFIQKVFLWNVQTIHVNWFTGKYNNWLLEWVWSKQCFGNILIIASGKYLPLSLRLWTFSVYWSSKI